MIGRLVHDIENLTNIMHHRCEYLRSLIKEKDVSSNVSSIESFINEVEVTNNYIKRILDVFYVLEANKYDLARLKRYHIQKLEWLLELVKKFKSCCNTRGISIHLKKTDVDFSNMVSLVSR